MVLATLKQEIPKRPRLLRLALAGEHPGERPGGTRAQLFGLQQHDPGAASGGMVGDRAPNCTPPITTTSVVSFMPSTPFGPCPEASSPHVSFESARASARRLDFTNAPAKRRRSHPREAYKRA